MSLETKSQELKDLVAVYNNQWFLGNLTELMQGIAQGRAQSQLGSLSSPLRQLYYLGGLSMTSDPVKGVKLQYSPEEWNKIIILLNEIELEYDEIFKPETEAERTEEWLRIQSVARPSFLSYFNQGPLNYEEQTSNWITDLYTGLDSIIEGQIGLKTIDFINFYNNLDTLHQNNFHAFTNDNKLLKPNWEDYTKMPIVPAYKMPEMMMEMFAERKPLMTLMADPGIKNRFIPNELISDGLDIDKVNLILNLLSCRRVQTDFIYYTETKPGNPLYEKPIIEIGDGMFQIFEVKQVLHAMEILFDEVCSKTEKNTSKLVKEKGKLLEEKVLAVFEKFLGKDCKIYTSYYVDGCEQDILILWKKYAFIIEAKGYKLKEPFRNPNRAFTRIKRDFNNSIGYGYKQTCRVEEKFVNQEPLNIEDKNGNITDTIDTTKYIEGDFSIIVNLNSFGQVQNDLSLLLEVDEENLFPWVVKLDDLEVFLLTMKAKKKKPFKLVNYLLMREKLHGKLICSDELEVCGAFLTNKLNIHKIEKLDKVIIFPDAAAIFDEQYYKGMGLDNEKRIDIKKKGNYIPW